MAAQSHLPTDVDTEFYIDGEWTNTYGGEDLAGRVRGGDRIRISRGLVDQQSAVSPVQSVFTLNNADGLFTDDNPLSPLFGKVGQNTPVRHGIRDAGGEWDEYLRLNNGGGDLDFQYVTTADKASLDIVGDIDIRMEVEFDQTRGESQILAAKYLATGNQRSWVVALVDTGAINFLWSTDGTFAALQSVSSGTYKIDVERRRFAFRVTMDVNNGSGGFTATFYDADTIAGPYTQRSQFAGVSGTTSIFSSTTALTLGSGSGGSVSFANNTDLCGKLYAAEIYSGIGGTLVADWKPYGRGVDNGTTSWVDTCASPNTWDIGNGARLGSDRVRFSGELNSIPTGWDVTGRDVSVTCTANGLLQRLSTASSPLRGAIYRTYRNEDSIYAWWPMEDAAGSTLIANGNSSPNGLPGVFDAVTFGAPTGLDGATGCATLTDGSDVSSIRLKTAGPLVFTGVSSTLFYFKMATLPGSSTTLAKVYMTGSTVARWDITIDATSFNFAAIASDGSTLDSGGATFGAGASPLDQWLGMQIRCTQEGGNIRWETLWHAVGTSTFYTHFVGGDTFAGTCGEFREAFLQAHDSSQANEQFAHFMFRNDSFTLNDFTFANASKAYAGELAGVRIIRLAAEEGVALDWVGDVDDTEAVGPQTAESLYANVTSAASVDGGILGEVRYARGLRYVTRKAMSNQRAIELSYSSSHLAETPSPIRDNRYLVNDYTANRPSGSSARYEATDGRRLNVSDPPAGAGRVEQSGSINVATDDQLPGQAQAKVFLGTWEERRIPNLAVSLNRSQIFSDNALLSQMISHDMGDTTTLTDLADTPMGAPDDRLLLTFGYTEEITGFTWDWVANTVPAGPYQVPIIDDEDEELEPRLDGESSAVQAAVDSDDVSLVVRTLATEPAWIDTSGWAAEFDVDIMVTGERMTLTAMTAATTSAAIDPGTFENPLGVSGWSASGGAIAQSSTFADAGTFSARLTVSGSPTQAYIRNTVAISVVAGASYTATMRCRTGSTLTVGATIDWLDSDGNFLSRDISSSSLASGAFATRTVTGTCPAGAAQAQYGSTLTGSPANGSLLYTDTVTFTSSTYVYQTATVTRSVNGIAKSHVSGEPVRLFHPSYLGMGS